MKTSNKLTTTLLALLIIGASVVITIILIKGRSTPIRHARPELGPLVKTITVERKEQQLNIRANGTVQASQVIDIIPQVTGLVTQLAPNFVQGGFFSKGELFFSIDPTDYELKLEQARAELARAELDHTTISGQAAIARQEWEMQSHSQGEEPMPLVVFTPQLKNAAAKIKAARAAVRQAEVNLARTKVKAPFPCFISSEHIDLGQYVRAGATMARIIGTDQAEIIVSLARTDLDWIVLPDDIDSKGSVATITLPGCGEQLNWQGRVDRLLGEIHQASRMNQIIITVDDPYQLKVSDSPRPQLAIGSFVQVQISAKPMLAVIAIPRQALRDGGQVWLIDQNNTLQIRQVTVSRRDRDNLYISNGLTAGEQVIISPLSGAAPGLKVRAKGADKR